MTPFCSLQLTGPHWTVIVVAVISSVILEVGAPDGAGGNIMYVYKLGPSCHEKIWYN